MTTKTCTYCDYLTALTMYDCCKKSQKKFWQSRIAVLQNKIAQARELRVLHLCGPGHRDLAKQLRAKKRKLRALEFIRRFEALRSAVKRYAEAERKLAEALKFHSSTAQTERLRWEVAHTKNLRAQRKRRLMELLPQQLMAQEVTTLAAFFAEMQREAQGASNLTGQKKRA